MEHCVKYALTAEEITQALHGFAPDAAKLRAILSGPRWEVWQGLPRAYDFSEIPSRGGKPGLLAAHKGVFIWVTPDVYDALDDISDEDEAAFLVYCDENPERRRRCDVWSVEEDLARAIAKACRLNANIITRKT